MFLILDESNCINFACEYKRINYNHIGVGDDEQLCDLPV